MDITRIDSYYDNRFSQNVLNQHGAYVIEDEPYAKQSFLAAKDVLMINPIDIEGQNHGGSSVLARSSLIKLRSIWIYLQGNKIDDNVGIVEIF